MDRLSQTAGRVAAELARINSSNAADLSVSGFGLKKKVERLIRLVRTALFPRIYGEQPARQAQMEALIGLHLQKAGLLLDEICRDLLANPHANHKELRRSDISRIVTEFLDSLPGISAVLHTDIVAAYAGDPAAKSAEEILLAYPAFEAISIYRLAHRLQTLGVPMLPRMMTEYAHGTTGIDIHPGAVIGEYFFIDHGTGVVIGETTVIGDHVKLYQGVTIGAKSFPSDKNGDPVKGIHRHPRIGNNVIIYAGATILGGDTVIGDNCVIGGNVWLTQSVSPGSIIYNG